MIRSPVNGWGPSQEQSPKAEGKQKLKHALTLAALVLCLSYPTPSLILLVSLLGLRWAYKTYLRLEAASGRTPELRPVLASARDRVYLGVKADGGWVWTRPERAVLVLGPPRSGKTSAVMIPALLTHAGAAVSASTKPDVLRSTADARSRLGHVWEFDPDGTGGVLADAQLRWSPVSAAASWDGALLIARAMVTGAGVGAGTTDSTHWAKRAWALLAPLLHAAAIERRGIETVCDWVLRHNLDEPALVLQSAQAEIAERVLLGLQNTEARERSSILSAAADALDAYNSAGALATAHEPNFDAHRFVRSRETIYIHAPAEHQGLAAPLVCGLLAEIRAATYQAHATGALAANVLFALDEAANIAPLGDLPQIASEGGGQGLTLLTALQDLSQARARWGTAADGFLTLYGEKLILPGIADRPTLETISLALGEYDRQLVSTTRGRPQGTLLAQISKTTSTQRQRVLSPGEIANIPHGQALQLDGVNWQLLTLTPAYRDEPWRSLITATAEPS